MTTLTKRKRRNKLQSPWSPRLFTPWNNDLLSPWKDNFFSSDFDDLRKSMELDTVFKDDFFEDDSLMPAMNVKNSENDLEIEFAAPGFNKDDFEVSIENDILHVSAKKEYKKSKEEENYTHKEFSYKSFKRSSLLPDSIDLDQTIIASYNNGILTIKLLKKEDNLQGEPPKKIIEVK